MKQKFFVFALFIFSLLLPALQVFAEEEENSIAKQRQERDTYYQHATMSPFTIIGRKVLEENKPLRVTLPGDTLLMGYPGADVGIPTLEFIWEKGSPVVYVRSPLGGKFYKDRQKIGPIPLSLVLGDTVVAEKYRLRLYDGSLGKSIMAYDPDLAKTVHLKDYPVNPDYNVEAKINRISNPDTLVVNTSTGKTRQYQRFATLDFTLKETPLSLTLFVPASNPESYGFIPFTDLTSGVETYGAGRYMDVELPGEEDTVMHLDFNGAYNPYCAYTPYYDCPIPPRENHLEIKIEAGEKTYH